ncbi:unnamed protein product [Rotaria sp. Silwood2]|nr:unnamed protein product [Rotaria sp. Silwood2]CAF2690159.1 unnamed protein product [Rotaria sp. Silwood2]CAF3107054.1 unnamed protein product [Rotaria sp. Silwood2]CAF4112010.1 unnamed protein product [Rotaria sp. Silwood2]CAF4351450.1 unnamed protein product [Rotaria sp. Silwood2]
MILRSIRFASSTTKTSPKPVDDYTYCINSVRKVDYENFICTGLLRPSLLQRPAMAIRALNVELASIRDHVSNTQIGQMRLQFWHETIDAIYSSLNTNAIKKINHPVAREIDLVIKHNQLSKLWFHRLIKSRETTLNDMPFQDIEQLENYVEQSITPTYYLLLELAKQRSLNVDHIASHLGRSQGLINIVRGIPYNSHKRRCFIPLSYLIQNNVSQQDLFNGQFANEQCRHVIYQLCNRSWFHLQKTLELFEQDKNFQKRNSFSSINNHNRSLFLPMIVIYDYLKQIPGLFGIYGDINFPLQKIFHCFRFRIMFGLSSTTTTQKDVEIVQPPDDAISCMKFSPATIPQTYLIASSWANDIRCWEIQSNGQSIAKAMQKHDAPILSCCWSDDGTKVFTASCDKTAKMWDLQSNTFVQIAAHDQPIRTINYIQRPSYSCVMTGSWDRTVKFWDTRQAAPLKQLIFSERIYAADVFGPMAVITTADRAIQVYSLDQGPTEYKKIESLLKYQHRCISIFTDKSRNPNGFAVGSIEGRVAIMYVDTPNPGADNFTFKCHRSNPTATAAAQDIFSVNDIAFHPMHGTLATVGSDGRYSFWDKDERTKLKTSDVINDQSITCCAFDSRGQLFSYASSYDWHKGHEGNIQTKKNIIFLRQCFEEMKPKQKK